MSKLIMFEGTRGEDMRVAFEDAMKRMDECDGVVILMQKKAGGFLWFAPAMMKLETMIFYLWSALILGE
jgi:hypothetical protein